MPNENGNIHPIWFINGKQQIMARDTQGNLLVKSNEGFARDISISENGIVWVLSNMPDPEGGGKLFWGKGNGEWTEINTPAPGGVRISGAGPNTCIYIAPDLTLWNMNTTGQGKQIYKGVPIYEVDNGGGFTWALMATQQGQAPTLHYTSFGVNPLVWHAYAENFEPSSFSAAFNAWCFGIIKNTPYSFKTDGKTATPFASGATGVALRISYKTQPVLVSTIATPNGNEVMLWENTRGGLFYKAGFTAIKVASSYYLG